jgi:hypothetical protein
MAVLGRLRNLAGGDKRGRCLTVSSAMENNIDVVIGRRFKKPGMSWTKEGANNLLKLRILCYNRNDWEEFWERQKILRDGILPQLNKTTDIGDTFYFCMSVSKRVMIV